MPLNSLQGEKFNYTISKMGIKAGEASLTFSGPEKIDDRDVYLILFRATALNFLDEEKIFVDPDTLFPVRVDRELNIFGRKESISEKYDSRSGKVVITKTVGKKVSEQVIEKAGQLDNIYCFIYRSRLNEKFTLGDRFKINLPTQNVAIRLVRKDALQIAGKKVESYFMQSDPNKYRVWFDTSSKKIPLRIDGAVGFGNTSMILQDY